MNFLGSPKYEFDIENIYKGLGIIPVTQNEPEFIVDDQPHRNGELDFFKSVSAQLKIVFDVGIKDRSEIYETNHSAHFYMFEPNPTYYKILYEKYTTSDVTLVNAGLGSKEGYSLLYPYCDSMCDRAKRSGAIDVYITTLDKYCEDLSINHIDYLKIDTEGYEVDVLLGSKNNLNNINYIQFEYGETFRDIGRSIKEVYNILDGWNIYLLTSKQLVKIKDPIENYIYSNYIACKKEL